MAWTVLEVVPEHARILVKNYSLDAVIERVRSTTNVARVTGAFLCYWIAPIIRFPISRPAVIQYERAALGRQWLLQAKNIVARAVYFKLVVNTATVGVPMGHWVTPRVIDRVFKARRATILRSVVRASKISS